MATGRGFVRQRREWLVGAVILSAGGLFTSPAAASGRGTVKAPSGTCALAQGLQPSREVIELRSATRQVFRHPCGGLVAEIAAAPVRFRDRDGHWQAIDNTLVARGSGALVNRANAVDVTLPRSLSGETRVARGSEWIAFRLRSAGGAARVRGATAAYRGALPDTDVRYSVTAGGLKEDIVITGRSAPREFVYRLRTSSGLTAREDGSGGVAFLDEAGERVAGFAPPFMQDAGSPAVLSGAVAVSLRRARAGYVLRLRPSRAWVLAHLRRGPVVVDPTVSFTPPTDCEMNSAAPDTGLCAATALGVGVTTAGSTTRRRRALVRFTIRRWLPKGARIFSSTLSLKTTKLPPSLKSVSVHDATRSWTSGATWNRYDGTNPWTAPGGDFTATAIATNAQVGDTLGGWEDWTVTAAVQRWADSGNTDGGFGLLLKQSNESTVQGDVEFASAEMSTGGAPFEQTDTPRLSVWYDNMTGDLPYYRFGHAEKLTDRQGMAVNVAGGNLLLRSRDLLIAGSGLDLVLDRFYNSREPTAGDLGWGWTYNVGSSVRIIQSGTSDAIFRGPTGFTTAFARQPDGSFRHPQGVDADLVKNADGTFTLTWRATAERWQFNAGGLLVEQADRNGRKLTLQYDAPNRLSRIVDTQNRVTTFARNAGGRITSVTDSTGRVAHRYAYNATGSGEVAAGGLTTTATDAAGKVTTYGYTGSLLTSITDPRGKVTSFAYDSDRRVTSVTRAGALTRFDYAQPNTGCANDLNTVVTDARGNRTTYCWEPPGRVTKVVDAAGQQRSLTWTANSTVRTFTNGTGGPTTTFGYDANDNLTSGSLPAGEGYTLGYTDTAHRFSPTSLLNAQGNRTLFGYDGTGNMTSVRDGASPAQSQATLEFNGSAGVCPSSGPTGTLRCAIDGKGNQTRYGYDALGNLTTITPPLPLGQTTITYDALSRARTIRDGKSQTRTFSYDALDRLTRVDYSDASSVSYAYDANGNRTSQTDSAAGTWSYVYDDRNRPTSETLPTAAVNQYAYDALSNLTQLVDRSGTVRYGYDALNRLSELIEPDGRRTTFGYDTRDNRTLTTFPVGVVEQRTYDGSDKVRTIRATNSAAQVLVDFAYTYRDATNRETELQQTMTDKFGDTTTYSYDGNDRLTRGLARNASGAVVDDRVYAYDAANNRTLETVNGQSTSSAYNAANQLCWRAAGATNVPCNTPPAGATTYTYDLNGNLTASSAGTSWQYNARNQTSSVTTAGTTSVLSHGGPGQSDLLRIGARTYQNNVLGIGILDGGPFGRADFVREPSGRLFSQLSSGRRHYILTDAQDSMVAIANTSGTLGGYFKYDPYGVRTTTIGQDAQHYFLYKGSPETVAGLYKFGERYYIPTQGRWTQLDAIDSPADLRDANRYIYVGADPVNLSDPTGLFPNPWKIAKCAAAIGGTVFIGAKIYRAIKALGGVRKAAQLLIGAGNVDDAIAAGGYAAAQLTGIVAVKEACF